MYIAVDEGNRMLFNGKDQNAHMTLQQCEEACTQTHGCRSFAHCPNDYNRCYLYDRRFTGSEPTVHQGYCTTYFKTGNLFQYRIQIAIKFFYY